MNNPIFTLSVVLLVFAAPLGAEVKPSAAKPTAKSTTTVRSTSSGRPTSPAKPSSAVVKRRQAVLAMSEQTDTKKAGQELVMALSDKDPMARTLAVQGLGNLQYTAARPQLEKVLAGDTSAETREAAAVSLRQLNDRKAVDALTKAISDPVLGVRVTALAGVGYYRDAKARTQVEAACQDANPAVRRTAVHVLGRLEDPKSVPVVEGLLKDQDSSVRAMAAQTLGELRATEATPRLVEMLKDSEKTVQISAARSLMKMGDSSGFDLARSYTLDDDIAVRLLAIDTLGWSKDKEAGKALDALVEQVPANSKIAVQEARARHEQMRKRK